MMWRKLPVKPQKWDYLLIIDFEATCDEDPDFKPQELIEFPCILFNTSTLQTEAEFQQYVTPVIHPKLTLYCSTLTGIQQKWVDDGLVFPKAFAKFFEFMYNNKLVEEIPALPPEGPNKGIIQSPDGKIYQITKKIMVVTCGDWDLREMLPNQCKMDNVIYPDLFREWVDIRTYFISTYNFKARGLGMYQILDVLQLQHTGAHHSGIDDCRNILKITKRLIEDGNLIETTSSTKALPI